MDQPTAEQALRQLEPLVGEQIEATVSCAGLNLDHVGRYVLQRPGERSRGAFAESPRS